MTLTYLINCRIVDANSDFRGYITIVDGLIVDVQEGDYNGELDNNVIDLAGKTIMPGFVDLHVHFRDPGYTYKEDIESGLKASVKGGFTTLCAMANTSPVCDNVEILKQNLVKANDQDLANFIQVSAIGSGLKDDELVDVESNRRYTQLFSNDGYTIFSDDLMRKALTASSKFDFLLLTHSDPETEIVERDLRLLEEVGGNLHVCHISLKSTLDAIVKAKDKGLNVTCETTPHHIFASGIDYRVNPSIATEDDRKAMIWGIENGYIDCLASDHAPHSIEDKEKGAPGISGIEVAFQMYWHAFKNAGLSLSKLSELMSAKPSELLDLNSGLIEVGQVADLVVVDPDVETTVEADKFISRSNNTPFDGAKTTGRVISTYVCGELKYNS